MTALIALALIAQTPVPAPVVQPAFLVEYANFMVPTWAATDAEATALAQAAKDDPRLQPYDQGLLSAVVPPLPARSPSPDEYAVAEARAAPTVELGRMAALLSPVTVTLGVPGPTKLVKIRYVRRVRAWARRYPTAAATSQLRQQAAYLALAAEYVTPYSLGRSPTYEDYAAMKEGGATQGDGPLPLALPSPPPATWNALVPVLDWTSTVSPSRPASSNAYSVIVVESRG